VELIEERVGLKKERVDLMRERVDVMETSRGGDGGACETRRVFSSRRQRLILAQACESVRPTYLENRRCTLKR
jgi:hypothetical protein